MDDLEMVRLVDGRSVAIPAHAGIDVMLEWIVSGAPLKQVAGESVLFWAQVDPDDDEGSLLLDLVARCRAIVAERP